MKKCLYCGAEFPDEVIVCPIDQTPFASPPGVINSIETRSRSCPKRLGYVLHYCTPILIVVLLYFLSFGPVMYYCGTVVSQNFTQTANTTVNGVTFVGKGIITVRYPHWVGEFYHPAFLMVVSHDGIGLYGRYIQWWNPRPANDDFTNSLPKKKQ